MKDPAFLFYTKDFQSGTQDMSCDEVGAYLRLLMHQHQNGFVPNDTERMMRICGVFNETQFTKIWSRISDKFITNGDQMVNQKMSDLINANEQIKYVFKLQLKRIAMAAIEQRRILSKI